MDGVGDPATPHVPVETIVAGYASGYVPWGTDDGLTWRVPNPRHYLDLTGARFPGSVRRRYRNRAWTVTVNSAFSTVLDACASAPRSNDVSWITPEVRSLYSRLHSAGFAWSFEVWQGADLVAGEFGVPLGGAFFAESKFHRVNGAGTYCTGASVLALADAGFRIYDTQYGHSDLARFSTTGLQTADFRDFPQLLAQAALARFKDHRRGRQTVPAFRS